jgi:hypothetical protein
VERQRGSDEWPESWRHVCRPVCPLERALYGHPDAGGYWEQHCDTNLRDVGFGPISKEDRAWRSCYFSSSLNCYLIVYVDDFKLAGPPEGVKEGWRLIRGDNPKTQARGLILDDPTPAGEPARFLGCNRICSEELAPPMTASPSTIVPSGGHTATDDKGY